MSWLRELVPVDTSIDTLAEGLTMRGFEVSAIEPAHASTETDAVLDLEITPNRPDCLSVAGIAREVATMYGTTVTWPALAAPPPHAGDGEGIDLAVTIEDAELCPRYAAAVAAVDVAPSPAWLAARLEAAGVRPINNIVDVTNYVMLELGHPMHAFDLDRLGGGELRIRRARAGERLRTLDGEDRALADDMLVIADGAQAQAVAGVMGGADSEVHESTTRVAFESAYFKPNSVRRTSRRLGLSTDASYRFERGADIGAPVTALRRAYAILAAIGGGEPKGGLIDRYPAPRAAIVVDLRQARIHRVLGVDVDAGVVATTLERLGFAVEPVESADDARWRVTVPSHRVDVSREIDLIEEVARYHGYDRLPSTFPAMVRPPAPVAAGIRRQRLLRRVLTASGCSEATTYGFIERAAAEPFVDTTDALVPVANPLSEKYAVLRPSLVPGLVDALIRNRRREHRDIRLFEIGHRFLRAGGESAGVAIALTGAGMVEHWSGRARPSDLFDVKGIVERLADAAGVTTHIEPTSRPELVPGRAAVVRGVRPGSDDVCTLGFLGQLLPSLATTRGLPVAGDDVYVAELDLDVLGGIAVDRSAVHVSALPRQPSIVRDLAIVVDASLPAATVRGTIRAVAPETLIDVREFDRYEGKGVPKGRLSLAFRLTFRHADRTLTDAEVQQTMSAIVTSLETTHQATLR